MLIAESFLKCKEKVATFLRLEVSYKMTANYILSVIL